MSIYHALEFPLKEILSKIKPGDEDRVTRVHIISEFQKVVESVGSLQGATIEPFGSFVSNLYTRWGDLDISIELPNGLYDFSIGKNRKQNLLRDLLRALRRKGDACNMEFIPNARVPILKFQSNYYGISCDISISNSLGQIKSKFLLWIAQIDERFCDLVLLVKQWAKALNINDPKAGTLNSYSLCLLVIFHFQTCKPAILPPLKEIYPGNIASDLTGVRSLKERHIQQICDANIARFRSNRFRKINQSSLSELFVSFFKKFSEINFKASRQVICTFNGRLEDVMSNTRRFSRICPLFIEDPFEQPENAARAVSLLQLTRISEAFEDTYHRLLADQERGSLIAALVKQEITPQLVIVKIPRLNPSTSSGHLGSRPQLGHALASTIHSQFQKMQLETSAPLVSLRIPGQTARQQSWRPTYSQTDERWDEGQPSKSNFFLKNGGSTSDSYCLADDW